MQHRARTLAGTSDLSWRVLGLLNLFRLLVPVVLLIAYTLPGPQRLVGSAHPLLFRISCYLYLLIGVLCITALKRRTQTTEWHAYLPVIVDVALMSVVIFASGGADTGLGILLIVPVAGLSVVAGTRGALTTAAAAVFALLGQQLASLAFDGTSLFALAQAGYYGVVMFAVATGGALMATRLRETEEVIRQRDIDLANLSELSEYVVQHLRESIVVIDFENRVRLINGSARSLLGPEATAGSLLGEISPRLLYHVERWRLKPAGAAAEAATFLAADGTREIEANFAALGRQRPASLIAFLTDPGQLAERVQQSKLTALGRLSASIAHEIRNPVGAMSHAAQLLAEAPGLGPQEQRLTEIITQNAERVSEIINNVLRMSRREETHPVRFDLGGWLQPFLAEFTGTLQLAPDAVRVLTAERNVDVRIDPTHLRQIVWNLAENAVRHSAELPGPPPVELLFGRLPSSARPFLEVADHGPGIPDTLAEQIFEPFFTGRRGGTGLGLFVARELAQCNGALLVYEPRAGGGCVFRIVFADPQRWEGRTDA
jgi:two-component system sensor histidine kinase PilS (NtrC family)